MSLEISSADRISRGHYCRLPAAVRVALFKKNLRLKDLAAEMGVSMSLVSQILTGEIKGYVHRSYIASRLGLSFKRAFGDSRLVPLKRCRYSDVVYRALRQKKITGRMIAGTTGMSTSLVSAVFTGGVRDRTRREQIAVCLGLNPAEIWPDFSTEKPAKGSNIHKRRVHEENILRSLEIADAPLTAKQVAEEVGLHRFSARKHLERMAAEGRVLRTAPSRPGRYQKKSPEGR